LAGAFALLACAAEPVASTTGITTYEDPVNTTAPVPTTSTSTGTPDAGDATDTDATTSTTSQHPSTSGPVPDFGGEGCSKIDVLYVLEQGAIPEEHRANGREGIVHFNQRLVETFAENIDLHMLVTTDAVEWPGDVCLEQCEEEGHCDLLGEPNFSCESLMNVHPCEKKAGAGHTFPIGPGAANRRCVGTNSQYLRSTTPDLLNTLQCSTNTGGNFEGPWYDAATMSMMAAVIEDGPDGCNEGFLRDDAPLIVVLVTTDGASDYPPDFWAQTLFDAKGGNMDAVGVIGIIRDGTVENPVCTPAANPDFPTDTVQFLRDHIPHHVFGSICSEDTPAYFDAGIEMMQELCEQYTPQ